MLPSKAEGALSKPVLSKKADLFATGKRSK